MAYATLAVRAETNTESEDKEMDNLFIYNRYREVPKEAVKPFDNGKFKGTDINTMWRIKCLTEQFGVVGFGWTVKVLRTWTELGANEEIMAFAEVEMKVKVDGEWSEPFTATGGNLMVRLVKGKNGNEGYYSNNDEAFKMAITDAFGVACKYLGIGADIYWANDRTKYTEDTAEPTPTAPTTEPKATVKQMELLNKLYSPEEMPKIYEWAKIDNLKDLTISQASALISKRKDKKQ